MKFLEKNSPKDPGSKSFNTIAEAASFDVSFVNKVFEALPDNRHIKEIDVVSRGARIWIDTLRKPIVPGTTVALRKDRVFLKCELVEAVSRSQLPIEITFSKLVSACGDINIPQVVTRFRIESNENGKPSLYKYTDLGMANMALDNHDRQPLILGKDLETIEYQ